MKDNKSTHRFIITSVVLQKFSTKKHIKRGIQKENDLTDSLNFKSVSKMPLQNSNSLFLSGHIVLKQSE